jgi:hypothetical protein
VGLGDRREPAGERRVGPLSGELGEVVGDQRRDGGAGEGASLLTPPFPDSRKGDVEPGSINALRGAGATGAAIRFGYTVCPMSEDDANAFDISKENTGWFFRMDKAKGNYSAPARSGKWFERGEVEIEGEWIGIANPWEPPKATRPNTHTLEQILEGIARGTKDGQPLVGEAF